ncbi:MAG: TIGR03862 family flavoprotein [Proteobacteria bacterium]|nr:TIGR03862 family flavoprotein [Pseudomonadota bacterium]
MTKPAPAADTVAVIGAGPAGLIAAERLSAAGLKVTVCDRMPSVGRKFLMAGRGGLNLTHSEPLEAFVARYGEASAWLAPMLRAFPPQGLIDWAEGLGQATFVGSSGRVFPKTLKASPLLRTWLARLAAQGVEVRTRREWQGWNEAGELVFALPDCGIESVRPSATVLALGGASWPKLGSTGGWAPMLAERGVATAPFRPANVGFDAAWSEVFRDRFAGQPLKGVALTFDRRRVRGEAMVTRYGLEGGAIYALSARLRDAIGAEGHADLWFDLRPDSSEAELAQKLAQVKAGQSLTNVLRKATGLEPVAINLMREAHGVALPSGPAALARAIKGSRVRLTGVQPLDRAISTAGGIALDAVDEHLMLTALPGVFAAGEMLDWEAPTGGYLLQACFATGWAAAGGVLARLGVEV